MTRTALAGASLLLALGVQMQPAEAQLPPGVYAGTRDYKAAAAGTYTLDPSHTAVIAKISHIGYGLSVFRFDKTEGTLRWDPAQPAMSSLTAVVYTISISSPVPGFASELAGKGYLNAAQYPDATFVSTAVHQIDPTHGKVDGQFSLMGKTRPLTFDVVLQGAGKGFMGHARIGIEAKGRFNPQDYGFSGMFGTALQIEIDAEFEQSA